MKIRKSLKSTYKQCYALNRDPWFRAKDVCFQFKNTHTRNIYLIMLISQIKPRFKQLTNNKSMALTNTTNSIFICEPCVDSHIFTSTLKTKRGIHCGFAINRKPTTYFMWIDKAIKIVQHQLDKLNCTMMS